MYKALLFLFFVCLCQQALGGCGGGRKKTGGCGVSYFCQKALPCCGNGRCQPEEGESCETCPEDCGQCAPCEAVCGNHLCEITESACSCPEDCGPCCCDGVCKWPETFLNCPLECGGSAFFKAVDSLSGAPLAGVNVTCYSETGALPELWTDYDGTVVFGELAPTSYACEGSLSGYYSSSAAFEVHPGKTASVPKLIPLKKMVTGSVTGYVVFNLTGYSSGILPGVNVTCGDQDIYTDREGRFHFWSLYPGTVSCNAVFPGFATTYFSLNVTAGNNTDTTVGLTPLPGSLSFSVIDSQALTPASGVSVVCNQTGWAVGGWSVAGKTSTNGLVTLNGLWVERGNEVLCSFSSPTYVNLQSLYYAERGQTEWYNIQLTKAAV